MSESRGGRKLGPAWLLAPAYEITEEQEAMHTEEELDSIAGNGPEIVDENAVGAMVRGDRRVASTLTERRVAARKMIEELHLDPQEEAERIGTLVAKLPEIISPLGYEVLPRTDSTGKRVRPTARFQRVGAGRVSPGTSTGGR